jgi:hypothetical protein
VTRSLWGGPFDGLALAVDQEQLGAVEAMAEMTLKRHLKRAAPAGGCSVIGFADG